jgi:hypothetical protein
MTNDKELRSAAKELITVLGLVDENKEDIVIKKTTSIKEIKKIINDVITEKLIAPTDELSEETKAVLESMTEKTPKQIADKLHKENIANAKPNSIKGMDNPEEDEKESDDEEEIEDENKEEIEDDDEVPEKKKPAKTTHAKTAPAKKERKLEGNAMKTRISCICAVLSSIPSRGRTLNELVIVADKDFGKAGGESNFDQTMRYFRVLIPAAIEWKIISKSDDKYFLAE